MNSNTGTTENTSRRSARTAAPKRRKGRAIVAFALAALAVGGIGAAATSAAWTDNVFFSAAASTQTFDLKGSTDNVTFADGGASANIVIPASTLANLLPGDTKTITLYVKNVGTSNSSIVASSSWAGGAGGFSTAPTVAFSNISTNTSSQTTLAAGATQTFTVTVTAPGNWDAANQGKSDTLTIAVAGTATH